MNKKGFIATIAIVILSSGILAFSFVSLFSVIIFSDSVSKKELRIQLGFNTKACLDWVYIMISKDYFISGAFDLNRFGCKVEIKNDLNGHVSFDLNTNFGGLKKSEKGEILFGDNDVTVI